MIVLKQNKLSQLFEDDKVEHHSKYDSINAHIKGLFSLTKINKEIEIFWYVASEGVSDIESDAFSFYKNF